MNDEPTAKETVVIGHCLGMTGAVSVERQGRVLNGLGKNASICALDRIRTHNDGAARIEFIDGGQLAMGGDTSCILQSYSFDAEQDAVTGRIEISTGTFMFAPSAAASTKDVIDIDFSEYALQVRSARVAARHLDAHFDMIAMLPMRSDGPSGDVLVSTFIGIGTLTEPWHCIRISVGSGELSPVMTVPSNVLGDVFVGTGIEHEIISLASTGAAEPSGGAFDVGAASFEPFHAMNDRLFERRFVPGQLYPDESRANDGSDNELLEDAFDGTRFRDNRNTDEIP